MNSTTADEFPVLRGAVISDVHDYDAETGTFGELIDSFPNEKHLLAWINDECNAPA